jgi:uncharacterized protein with GYD domain
LAKQTVKAAGVEFKAFYLTREQCDIVVSTEALYQKVYTATILVAESAGMEVTPEGLEVVHAEVAPASQRFGRDDVGHHLHFQRVDDGPVQPFG